MDELAQLLNVLNGSMSLVDPRPEVREYIDVYPEEIKNLVLSVQPGTLISRLLSLKTKIKC